MNRLSKMRPKLLVAAVAAVSLGGVIAVAANAPAESLPGIGLGRFFVGTVIVIGLLVMTLRYLPRFGGARAFEGSSFRVVSSLAVGQRERVVVIQAGERQLMLGVAPGRVEKICEFEEPLLKASLPGTAEKLPAQAWLARVIGRGA